METTRRLAAIMFTDIVDYTKVMQASEAAAVSVRQRHREVFVSVTEKYNGEIVNYYGDGTLSIFDSTVNATKCAAELQVRFLQKPDIPVRIGLHAGDIIVNESDIIGDSVNVASRIESLGVAGSVLLSGKILEELKNQDDLPVKHLGKFHFKNVKEPLEVYALAVPGIITPKASQLKGKLEQSSEPKGIKAIRITRTNAALSVLIVMLVISSAWFIRRQNKISWAMHEAIPAAQTLIESSWRDYTDAFELAQKALKILPENEEVRDVIRKASLTIDVNTEPDGADVYVKPYGQPEKKWQHIGVTPIENVRLSKSFMRWKIEKAGYDTVYAVEPSFDVGYPNASTEYTKYDLLKPNPFFRQLAETNTLPDGMIRVAGKQTSSGVLKDFFIDKHEVTNQEYKEFINHGGYQDKSLWKIAFRHNNDTLSWEEAMSLFLDKTGRQGPATWEASDFPDGEDYYPVGGISWHEAAAYAEFVGKSLPTKDHWGLAQGEHEMISNWPQLGGYGLIAPFSNFGSQGPVSVGSMPGMTIYGAMDMAGNVNEWCWNETKAGRLLRGGAWNSNTYSFGALNQAPAFDRAPSNGFRCALYPEPDSVAAASRTKLTHSGFFDIDYDLEPVTDDVFEFYKQYYDYDQTDLNAQVINTDKSHEDWIEEKVMFDAAYGDEKVSGYLFLPNNSVPPYQVVIYVPGAASLVQSSSENISEYYEFPVFLDFIVKSGIAVFYPVYKGTFERQLETLLLFADKAETHEYAELIAMVVKDFRRSIDYLETREDIDAEKIAYYGMSWGAVLAPIVSTVESRVKTNIILSGGLGIKRRPEVMTVNFLPRVKAPTLMLNGKYDSIFSLEKSIQPMFDMLGTPEMDKKLILFESDHIPPRREMIKEILDWLDARFGPVNRLKM